MKNHANGFGKTTFSPFLVRGHAHGPLDTSIGVILVGVPDGPASGRSLAATAKTSRLLECAN
jgi:hypothetical protein